MRNSLKKYLASLLSVSFALFSFLTLAGGDDGEKVVYEYPEVTHVEDKKGGWFKGLFGRGKKSGGEASASSSSFPRRYVKSLDAELNTLCPAVFEATCSSKPNSASIRLCREKFVARRFIRSEIMEGLAENKNYKTRKDTRRQFEAHADGASPPSLTQQAQNEEGDDYINPQVDPVGLIPALKKRFSRAVDKNKEINSLRKNDLYEQCRYDAVAASYGHTLLDAWTAINNGADCTTTLSKAKQALSENDLGSHKSFQSSLGVTNNYSADIYDLSCGRTKCGETYKFATGSSQREVPYSLSTNEPQYNSCRKGGALFGGGKIHLPKGKGALVLGGLIAAGVGIAALFGGGGDDAGCPEGKYKNKDGKCVSYCKNGKKRDEHGKCSKKKCGKGKKLNKKGKCVKSGCGKGFRKNKKGKCVKVTPPPPPPGKPKPPGNPPPPPPGNPGPQRESPPPGNVTPGVVKTSGTSEGPGAGGQSASVTQTSGTAAAPPAGATQAQETVTTGHALAKDGGIPTDLEGRSIGGGGDQVDKINEK